MAGSGGRGRSGNGRSARWARRLPVLVLLLLLLLWPLTHRYTSIGIDTETQQGESVEGRHYRLRWPGDGSVMVGWIDEHRSAGEGPAVAVDVGALVLQPPRPMTARSTWNDLGFWYEDVVAARGDRSSEAAPQADRVLLLGAPHWLFVALAALVVVARRRRPPADTAWRGGIRATPR